MKLITNWDKATCFDTEGDGLLDTISKFHVLSYHTHDSKRGSIKGNDIEAFKRFFTYHIENKIPVVCHNVIDYDIPAVEMLLGMDLSELMAIDTLYLSYYLNVNRKLHGLDSFFDDYGIRKPPIDDWVTQPYEVYRHRCVEDVKIQHALWTDLLARLVNMSENTKSAIDGGLVGGKRMSEDEVTYLDQFVGTSSVEDYVDRTLTFLMFKADMARLREKTRFKLDVPHINAKIETFSSHIEAAKKILESVMPDVPKYADKKKPANPYKNAPKSTTEQVYIVEGERKVLSASAHKWNKVMAQIGKTDEFGNPLVKTIEGDGSKVKVLKGLVPPNAGSGAQLKAWLFSHGWIPQTFEIKDDEPAMKIWIANERHGKKPDKRYIPQISKDGDEGKELCPSVLKLAEEVPEVLHYQKYTTIKNRLDTFKGFAKNMDEDGFIKCGVGGLTNTLREKHRRVVNLPGVHKPYGGDIRGSFIAGEGNTALGSDLSSLEDRCKHHFMLPHDPEYVQTMMADDFDPHILTALSAGLVTQAVFDAFMSGEKLHDAIDARRAGKSCNYASTYNAQPPTIARSAGVSLELGKKLFDGYWKLNWSIKAIASEQYVFTCDKGLKWLVNPINGVCYSLRKESDRFSTLNQGTGSFFFDMWVNNVMIAMKKEYGECSLSLLMHDELVIVIKDTEKLRNELEQITLEAIEEVNRVYKLRRKLGADVQFGPTYADIH